MYCNVIMKHDDDDDDDDYSSLIIANFLFHLIPKFESREI